MEMLDSSWQGHGKGITGVILPSEVLTEMEKESLPIPVSIELQVREAKHELKISWDPGWKFLGTWNKIKLHYNVLNKLSTAFLY